MITSIKRNQGVTLAEILLVIVVVAAIIYYSIQQVYELRLSANALQVRANADVILEAMGNYYRANCYGQVGLNNNGQLGQVSSWGILNPNSSPTSSVPLNIGTQLITPGYLNISIPYNPVVNSTSTAGGAYNGYIAQFNITSTPRTICTEAGTSPAVGLNFSPSCKKTQTVGTIYSVTAQVAVNLQVAATANQYLQLLGGDCLSSLEGTAVTPCSSVASFAGSPVASAGKTYVVFQRNPSMANLYGTSNYWGTMPVVKQFAQQYQTYESEYLLQSGGTTPGGIQYYTCGN